MELNTASELWGAFWAAAVFTGAGTAFLGWLIWKVVDYFRTWVIWWDEDAGRVEIERRKVKESTLFRGKDKTGRAYFLHAKARKTANKGSAYVIDVYTGMNLIGPSRSETKALLEEAAKREGLQLTLEPNGVLKGTQDHVAKLKKLQTALVQKLQACDPLFAFNMLKTNSYKKFHRTQEGEESWIVKVAPFALGAVFVLGVVLIWLGNAYTKTKGA